MSTKIHRDETNFPGPLRRCGPRVCRHRIRPHAHQVGQLHRARWISAVSSTRGRAHHLQERPGQQPHPRATRSTPLRTPSGQYVVRPESGTLTAPIRSFPRSFFTPTLTPLRQVQCRMGLGYNKWLVRMTVGIRDQTVQSRGASQVGDGRSKVETSPAPQNAQVDVIPLGGVLPPRTPSRT